MRLLKVSSGVLIGLILGMGISGEVREAVGQSASSHVVISVDQASDGLYLVDGSTLKTEGPVLAGELMQARGGLLDLAFTPDGRVALVCNFNESSIYFVDLTDVREPHVSGRVNVGFFPEDLAVTPDGRFAVVSDGISGRRGSTVLAVVDVAAQATVHTYDIRPKKAQAVAVTPDGRRVLVMGWEESQNGALHVFDLDPDTGALTDRDETVEIGRGALNVEVGPDGRTVLVTTSRDGLYVFELNSSGELLAREVIPDVLAQSVAFHPNGTEAYALDINASPDQLVRLEILQPGVVRESGSRLDLLTDASSSALFGVDVIAVTGDGARAYVGTPDLSTQDISALSVVDLLTWERISTVEVGRNPASVAVNTANPRESVSIAVAVETESPVGVAGEEGLARLGVPVEITAKVTGPLTPSRQILHYRAGGDSLFASVEMSPHEEGVRGSIPGTLVGLGGVEYYISVSDDSRNVTYPALRPDASPASVRVRLDGFALPAVLDPGRYAMVSIPLELDAQTAAAVLEDDLGPFDPEAWRLYRWDSGRQAYTPLPDLETGLLPGAAYWLAARNRARLDVGGAWSVSTLQPFELVLRPGWNQIGMPFAFPVAWNRVEGAGRVEPPVAWDGGEYRYGTATLEPWQGYFVFNPEAEDVILRVPPRASVGVEADASPEAPYALRIAGTVEAKAWRDTRNRVGFVEGGASVLRREAPPVAGGLQVSILDGGEAMAESLRPEAEGGAVWEVDVRVDESGAGETHRVDLVVEELHRRPGDYTWAVLDPVEHIRIEPEGGRFAVWVRSGETRRLQIAAGRSDYVARVVGSVPTVPVATRLDPAYPNPFRQRAAIPFSLLEREDVRVDVFDMLGRHVRALASGWHEAGRHTVAWDGKDEAARPVAGGVYLVRMQTTRHSAVQTVTVAR